MCVPVDVHTLHTYVQARLKGADQWSGRRQLGRRDGRGGGRPNVAPSHVSLLERERERVGSGNAQEPDSKGWVFFPAGALT